MIDRRAILRGAAAIPALLSAGPILAAPEPLKVIDGFGSELVLNLIVTCSDMEPTGGNEVRGPSRDGVREEVWPIVGGRFWGKDIRGTVVPGGADLPVTRPDGVEIVDALYRLRTDDGVSILIHNKGLFYPASPGRGERFRLQPEFFAPAGRYDWLNKSIFVSTLVDPVPAELRMAKGPHQNDRLIQVFKIT